MKNTLVIRFEQPQLDHSTMIKWMLFDEQQQRISNSTTELAKISQVANQYSDNYRVCVIVAAEEVLLTSTHIPSTQPKQVKQALPFMVEELLAQEIEAVHLAVPTPLTLVNGVIDVGVVQHTVLIHWLDLLHSNHLSPTSITIDTLCVPRDEASWSLIVDNNRLLIRTGDNAGLACEFDDIEMIISSLIRKLERDNTSTESVLPLINLIETESANDNPGLITKIADYIHSSFPDFEVKETRYEEDTSNVFASQYLREFSNTLNILQGGYRVSTGTRKGLYKWGMAASIAGIGLAVYLALSLASGLYFTQQAKKLDSDAVALYKRIFPNERRVVSPKKQMQNHLNPLSSAQLASGFLPLIAQTAQQFGSSGDVADLMVQQLRFDSDRNDLQLEIQSQSIEQLDQFKQLLADSGLRVDINSATERDDSVVGRLIVREK